MACSTNLSRRALLWKGLACLGIWCLVLSAILTLKSQVTGEEIHPSCPSFFPMKMAHLPLALNYAISTGP